LMIVSPGLTKFDPPCRSKTSSLVLIE